MVLKRKRREEGGMRVRHSAVLQGKMAGERCVYVLYTSYVCAPHVP